MRKQTITMPLLCVWLSVGFLLGSRAPRATAGSLTLTGNLNTVSNLTASTITLNSQTISNWPSGNLGGGAAVLSNAVLDFTQPAYFYQFTLTSNATWVFTNHVAGKTLWLQINQDTTGGWSNTWPAGLLGPGGAPINNTAVNPTAFSVFQILDTGSSWVTLTAGQNYMTPCTSNCNYALQFDGSQNYGLASLPAMSPPFTIECWFQANAYNNPTLVSTYTGAGGWGLQAFPDFVVVFVFDGSGTFQYLQPSASPIDGDWHHEALTYDGTTLTLWFDGNSMGTLGISGYTDGDGTVGFSLHGGITPSPEWKGLIDEVRVSSGLRYTNTFDTCQSVHFTNDANTIALWHFDEGSGATTSDSSGNGHNVTLYGSPLPAWATPGTGCDGGGSYEDVMGGFGGSHFSSGMTGGSSMTSTSSSTGGSSMTITDTLGRIWSLVH